MKRLNKDQSRWTVCDSFSLIRVCRKNRLKFLVFIGEDETDVCRVKQLQDFFVFIRCENNLWRPLDGWEVWVLVKLPFKSYILIAVVCCLHLPTNQEEECQPNKQKEKWLQACQWYEQMLLTELRNAVLVFMFSRTNHKLKFTHAQSINPLNCGGLHSVTSGRRMFTCWRRNFPPVAFKTPRLTWIFDLTSFSNLLKNFYK